MCFLNVLQHFRFGLSQRYNQIQLFFQQILSSQTWIIFSGEFSRRWMIISLHGYFGAFGKEEIIKFSVIQTLILGKHLNWQKQNHHSGLRHIYRTNTRQYHTPLQPYHQFQKDGVSLTVPGKRMIFSPDKVSSALQKNLMG